MTQIIPAILPSSYRAIEAGVEKVHTILDTVQIDFVDGTFAPNRTWLFNNKDSDRMSEILSEDAGLPYWDSMNYELDLMVASPLEHMDTFVALGPSKIIFHIEGLDTEEMLAYFEELPEIVKQTITFGMAIGIETDPSLLAPYMPHIDTIQCMGIMQVGFQGQKFDERVIEQIQKVKALYPDKIISVDGGMNIETAAIVAKAGADAVVVGSALFQSNDVHGTIQAIKRACRLATSTYENSN